jgi:hypothetical protein
MPGDPKECRENAKRCLELAQTARTEADRERFGGLAGRWLALATDFEAASLLLGKWGSKPTTFSDHPTPATRNPSAQRLSSGTPSTDQSPEAVPCPRQAMT